MGESTPEVQPDKPKQTEPVAESGFSLTESARHLAYSALQKPVTGVAQWVDHEAGTHLTAATEFIDRPKESQFGSAQWHADQIASGVGGFVPYIAAMAVTRGALKSVGAETLSVKFAGTETARVASIYRTGEAGAAGFVNGMLFEPTNDQTNFVGDHVRQGITGGINFGVMHGLSNQISKFTGASAVDSTWINRSATTALAGVGGGIAASVADSAIYTGSLDPEELAKTAYQSAFTGFALGAGADHFLRLHQAKSNYPEVQQFMADQWLAHSGLGNKYMSWNRAQSVSGLIGIGLESAVKREIPNRALFDYNALNRVELIADIERRADKFFAKPAVMKDFLDVFDKQTDLRDLEHKVLEARDRYYEAKEKQPKTNWWEEKIDTTAADVPWSEAWLEKQKNKSPELKHKLELEQQLDEAVAQRKLELQDSINTFLEKHKLPAVELRDDPELEKFSGTYDTGGLVTLQPHYFEGGKLHSLTVEVVAHELTHLRQDALAARQFADEIGIGKDATPEQFQQLLAKYIEHHNHAEFEKARDSLRGKKGLGPLPEPIDENRTSAFLKNVLRLRDGQVLTKEEVADIPPGTREDLNFGVKVFKLAKQHDNLAKVSTVDDIPDVSFDQMFHDIVNNPEKFKAEFGFRKIPKPLQKFASEHVDPNVEPSKREPGSPDKFNFYEHQKEWNSGIKPYFLMRQIMTGLQVLKLGAQGQYAYYNNPSEQTAHPTGKLYGWAYQLREDNH